MEKLRVGLVGYKFMGKAHANAYRQAGHFFALPVPFRLQVLCGRNAEAVREAARTYGFEETETDWRKLVARDDVDLIDIATPGDSHADIAVAAAENGKHVFCEKPLANTLAEARAMARAVEDAGVVNMVNFNYRRVPAVRLAKNLVDSGQLGTLYHWRAVYLQDWVMDPDFPLLWRLQKDAAGAGAISDLGAHIIDLAHMFMGSVTEVSALAETFIKERPLVDDPQETGEVTVDDAAAFLTRFESGALGTFEVSRFAKGRANYNVFEINGSKGSLRFDLHRLNELELYLDDAPEDTRGFKTILVTEATQPYMDAWWPPGHIIGWEHTFTHAVRDLAHAIAEGASPQPSFRDGVRCQAVIDAVERSAETKAWTRPDY